MEGDNFLPPNAVPTRKEMNPERKEMIPERKETIPKRKEEIPRGRRCPEDSREECPEDGDCREEGDAPEDDAQMKTMPGRRGCPEGEDA